ncbi:MAG: type II secretion system protein M [Pseudomonadales bacterium]|nr:type II secretion system protein M [Pseudomonadales bacterium]
MALKDQSIVRNLSSRYQSLDKRERLAVLALGTFFAGLILVYGIWMPAMDYQQQSLAERDRQLSLLQYMRASEQQARAASGSNRSAGGSGQSLLTQVSRSAQQFNIKPNRLQPEGDDAVSVWFDGVSFNDLAAWLQQQSRQGVVVRQISVDREEVTGTVNARIILRQ